MIKIIQSSPPHTASTLLSNLIHGFICPQEEIQYSSDVIDNFLITKTHNLNIIDLENKYPQYKLFFIMSERNDSKVKAKINNELKKKSNVLVINYDKLLETNNNSIKNIIDYIFNEFNNFIPKELKPNKDDDLIKDDMENRMKIVNETVENMKDKLFDEYDKFTSIHGSHRNRPI
jgi:hypothetical protein